MSVEFTVQDSSLTLDDWDRLLDAANDWDLNDHSEPAFSQAGIGHVLVPGSVRGVLVSHGGSPDLVTIRLGAFSSRADWRAAYALAERALGEGGGSLVRESGETYSQGELSDELADEHALADFLPTAHMLRGHLQQSESGGAVSMPLGRFSLPLTLADLPEGFSAEHALALEESLATRVERYATAFAASTLELEGGVRVGTWAQIPTVVGPVHLVACSAFDAEGGLIPLEDLVAALGARAEALGEGGYFLPELEVASEPALLERLEAARVQVPAWAEANAERLAEEARQRSERSPTQVKLMSEGQASEEYAPYRGLLMFVMAGVSQQVPPDQIFAALREREVPEEVAHTVLSLVGMTLARLYDEQEQPRDPGEAFQELCQEGIPSGLAALTLEVVLGVLTGEIDLSAGGEDEDDDE